MLREIDRGRAALGEALRWQMQEVEGEFEVVEKTPAEAKSSRVCAGPEVISYQAKIPGNPVNETAAASGIAWINSVGNLGGFFGPTMVGWAKDYTGSFAGGLYALAAFALMSAVISALWLRIPNPVRGELASVPAE